MRLNSKDLGQVAFAASIAFHCGVWLGLYFHQTKKIEFAHPDKIEIVVMDKETVKAKPIPPPPPPPVMKTTQVVQQDQTPTKQLPNPNAKYLGAKNQTVVKETHAKNSGHFKNVDAEKKEIQTDQKSEVVQQTATSQSDDYLKDVASGMQTMLNTQEFAYYNYYQKIKDKVRTNWEPLVGSRVRLQMKQNRGVASTGEHVTRILIIIDKSGELSKIDIVGGSGLKDADAAALEAFKKASPFGVPPKGLVNEVGEVRMRWDLVLESLE